MIRIRICTSLRIKRQLESLRRRRLLLVARSLLRFLSIFYEENPAVSSPDHRTLHPRPLSCVATSSVYFETKP